MLGGGLGAGDLLLGLVGGGAAHLLGLRVGLLGVLGGGAQQALGVGLGAVQGGFGGGLGLAAGGVDVGGGLGAGVVGEGGGLGAGGGDQTLGLGAGLLEQALGLLLGACSGLLGPGDVLVDVPLGAAAQLGELVVELAAAVGELGLQPGGAVGGLGHQPLGGRLGLAQLAFGVRAQLLGLHLGVPQELFGLAGDGVECAWLSELPTGFVQLGPEHLHLVGEVLGMLDSLVPLLASPIHVGLELGEVIVSLVAVVAPHSAVPSISWSRPRPCRPASQHCPGSGPTGPCIRSRWTTPRSCWGRPPRSGSWPVARGASALLRPGGLLGELLPCGEW